jgi:carboxymethylenebutenolidase
MGFKGEKITHEHIYWEQATVLVQLGLLDRSTLRVSDAEEAERLLELAGASDSG